MVWRNVYLAIGESDEASEIYEEILADKNSSETSQAMARSGIAGIELMDEDYEAAEKDYNETLRVFYKDPVKEKRNIAQTKINLAMIYNKNKRYNEGIAFLREAIAALEEQPAMNIIKILDAKNLLATIMFNAGDEAGGARLFEELASAYEAQLGPESASRVSPLMNLAIYAFTKENYSRAEVLYDQAFKIWDKARFDLQTGITLKASLGGTFIKENKWSEAARAYEELLPLVVQRDGEKSEAVKFTKKKIKELKKKSGG